MADFGAVWAPSPIGNFDYTRAPVDLIVDHHTAATLQQTLDRFLTVGSLVSAHFVVDHDGTVYQCVSIGATAYHSGLYAVNQRSIGIEHVSIGPNGEIDYFTVAQYAASGRIHAQAGAHFGFPIDPDHVWPHSRVIATECPGLLDLSRLIAVAASSPQGDDMTPEQDQRLKDVYNYVRDLDEVRVPALSAQLTALKAELDAVKAALPTAGTHSVTGSLTIS